MRLSLSVGDGDAIGNVGRNGLGESFSIALGGPAKLAALALILIDIHFRAARDDRILALEKLEAWQVAALVVFLAAQF